MVIVTSGGISVSCPGDPWSMLVELESERKEASSCKNFTFFGVTIFPSYE